MRIVQFIVICLLVGNYSATAQNHYIIRNILEK